MLQENLGNLGSTLSIPQFNSLVERFLEAAKTASENSPVVFHDYEFTIDPNLNLAMLDLHPDSDHLSGELAAQVADQKNREKAVQEILDTNWTTVCKIFDRLVFSSETENIKERTKVIVEELISKESDEQERHRLIVIAEKLRDGDVVSSKTYFMARLFFSGNYPAEVLAFTLLWMLLEEELATADSQQTVELANKSLEQLRVTYPFVMLVKDIVLAKGFYDSRTGEPVDTTAIVNVVPGARRTPISKIGIDKFDNREQVLKKSETLVQTILHESIHLALDHLDDDADITEMITQYATMRIMYENMSDKTRPFSGYIWKSNGYVRLALLADALASCGLPGVTSETVLDFALKQDDKGFVEAVDAALKANSDYRNLIDMLENHLVIGPVQFLSLKNKEEITLNDLLKATEGYAEQVGASFADSPGTMINGYRSAYKLATGLDITMEDVRDDREKRQAFINFVIESR